MAHSSNSATQIERKPREKKKREEHGGRDPILFYESPLGRTEKTYGYICQRCGSHNALSARQCTVCGYIVPP